MVKSVTNLTGSGLKDWLLQRLSAVILAIYAIVLVGFFCCAEVNFANWQQFFFHPLMQILSLLALLALIVHAWIGMWTVFTDYVKCYVLRLTLLALMLLALITYLAWGIAIIWR